MTSENGIGSMAEAIAEEADSDQSSEGSASEKWPSALATLLSARIAIVSVESRDALAVFLGKAALGFAAAFCGFIFWLTLIVGLIGGIPQVSALAWFHVAFILAGLHLLAAVVSVAMLLKQPPPVFTVTKSEFTKDKLWLSSVKQESTSKN